MKIDDRDVPEAAIESWKASLDQASDSDLAWLGARHKNLSAGFRPGKVPPGEVRIRAKKTLETSRGLPDDYKDVLARSGYYRSLICVLSEEALSTTGNALSTVFGRCAVPAAMLLDQRQDVRELGFGLLTDWNGRDSAVDEKNEARKKIFQDLAPFLSHMKGLLADGDLPGPQSNSSAVIGVAQPRVARSRDVVLRLRSERKVSRQLQRDLKNATFQRDRLQILVGSQRAELDAVQAEADRLRKRIADVEGTLDQRVRSRVEAELDSRLRPWLVAAEALQQDSVELLSDNVLMLAETTLERQAKEDARFGLLTQLRAELDRTIVMLTRVRLAMVESLNPLDELVPLADRLEAHRRELEKMLGDVPAVKAEQSASLARLRHTLAAAKSLDEISEVRGALHASEGLGLLSAEETLIAYRMVHEAASRVYDRYLITATSTQRNSNLSGVPMYALQSELARGRICTLVVDGHNVLHKLPTLFRPDYEAGQPGAKARKSLESRLLGLCTKYPTLSIQLWFDGPVVEERALTSKLRVRFSGGVGTDRADRQIGAYLQHLKASSPEQLRFVASADSEVANYGTSSGAAVLMPVELGLLLA